MAAVNGIAYYSSIPRDTLPPVIIYFFCISQGDLKKKKKKKNQNSKAVKRIETVTRFHVQKINAESESFIQHEMDVRV